MRKKRLVSVEEIERVKIKTYSLAVKNHDHTDIKGSASAENVYSIQFCGNLFDGKTGVDAFPRDVLNNISIRALAKKVVVMEDAQMTAVFPKKQ